MSKLIDSIVNKNFVESDSILSETVELIMARKLEEAKKMCSAKITEQGLNATAAELRRKDIVEKEEELDEKRGLWDNIHAKRKRIKSGSGERMRKPGSEGAPSEKDLKSSQTEEAQLDEARIKVVKARIRGGQIQRRKRISNVPGMTIRGGKLQRMSPAERRRRKMGARRGKIKRQAKMNRAIMKRQRSIRKRKALGI